MLTDQIIEDAVSRYEREYDRYLKLADFAYARCQEMVEDAGVRARVQRRAKAPKSLRDKLRRYKSTEAGRARFENVEAVFEKMADLAAVRITTYLESDRARIVEKLRDEFVVLETEEKKPAGDAEIGRHYRAIHCQVSLLEADFADGNANLRDAHCEIQVSSMLAHVWNEIEHDLRYKPTTGSLSLGEIELLDALGHLVLSGDTVIKSLLDATAKRMREHKGEFTDVHDFIFRMREYFSNVSRFSENANQLYEELLTLNLDSPRVIESALLDDSDPEKSAGELLQSLSEYLESIGDEVPGPPLDGQSSDLLMMLLFDSRADEIVSNHPGGPGLGRPSRLVYLARRFHRMKNQEESSEVR